MNPLLKMAVKVHVWLYRSSGGKRASTMGGKQVLLLTTRGRKTGAQRTVPLMPYEENGETYVMASMGGQPQHPAWYFNIEGNPEVEVQRGAERFRAHAEVLPPAQRDEIWSRVTAAMPQFAEYQKKTSRVIPVVRLARQN